MDEEPGWYALRNVVYATGWRIMASKSQTFADASEASWGFFENALSVHTEMLYLRSSILSVQALVLMVSPSSVSNA